VLDDPAGFDAHCRQLYGSSGQHSLPECATSVSEFVDSLESQAPALPDELVSGLNAAITVEEVESALLRMKNGRMAGPDGMRGELLKGAYGEWELPDGTIKQLFTLSRKLRDICNQAFTTGEVPAVWNSAFLCCVFKRGDASVKDSYRGIAVGSTMGKLFSMTLEKRLSAFCEFLGLLVKHALGLTVAPAIMCLC
jgi:hypothetical protein